MTTRRQFVKTAAAGVVASATASLSPAAVPGRPEGPDQRTGALPRRENRGAIRLCLNTSTIRGQNLSLPEQVDLAAEAGYDGIEPWIRDIEAYIRQGGSLDALRDRIAAAGLKVEGAIGFARWIVDDDVERAAALTQAEHDMRLVKSIGGSRIAAPPIGAHRVAGPDLPTVARRYRDLLIRGNEIGVTPMLELWGPSKTISKIGELAYVATAAEHPDACFLPDFYHLYKGGNDFAGLALIEASRIPLFHINDYPAHPPIESIGDQHRVFPGDGICPLPQLIAMLIQNGFRGAFSLELFNPEYWKRDAAEVCREGLAKTRQVVAEATQWIAANSSKG